MKATQPIVYVVDDDASVRKGLSRLLRSAGRRVITFEDPNVFLETERDKGPACLVLDMMLPGLTGLDVQAKLKPMSSHLPIIFITGHGTVPASVQALKEGAADFLEKPFDDDVLLAAIDTALKNHMNVLADDHEIEEARKNHATLTSREREVMTLTVKGLRNKEIADLLEIAEKTVKVHRGRVMQKMRADSLADLVRTAERSSLA
ncbi:MAG: response regulator transcription factor [Deltaproteobacteria bacterium]|nr:response regulator transcription factor [Deltaproteobacteria bacterium]